MSEHHSPNGNDPATPAPAPVPDVAGGYADGSTGGPTAYVQPGGYPPRSARGPGSRLLLVIGSVLGVLVIAWAALFLVDLVLSTTTTTHESYDAVETVELVADGDVTVSVAEGGIEVDAIATSGLRSPRYADSRHPDLLEIRHECPWWYLMLPRCTGDLDVTVPADTEVLVHTSNGDIVARGVAGNVNLSTSNGRITAQEIGGPLAARSSNGRVEVRDAGDRADLTTSNGDISVAGVDGDAVVDTSNGDITISTVGGDATAETSNGRIEIDGVAGDVEAESSNGSISVTGDGEAVALTIETSNGEQIIEGPTDPGADRSVRMRSSNGDVRYLVE